MKHPEAVLALALSLWMQPALAESEPPAATDPQMAAFDEFSARFNAGQYAEALPLAQRVVELTKDDPERDTELPIAYNNLGATQLRLGDLDAAEASYQTSLELLEMTQGISSRRLISPLAGLGAVYAARDQHLRAAENLSRALAVSRRADGLFNLGQVELINQLVASYLAVGNLPGVDRERRYALQVAEQNYGYDDPRMLGPLAELASWYEQTRRYGPARGLYLRIREIAGQEGSDLNVPLIRALLGIGRTYRLQFMVDPESLIRYAKHVDPMTGQQIPFRIVRQPLAPKLDRGGLQALQEALELLSAASDPPPRLLAETHLELGDWHMVAYKRDLAMTHYGAAWLLFPGVLREGERNPLAEPRLVFYRPPDSAIRHRDSPRPPVEVHTAEFFIDVDAEGNATDVRLADSLLNDFQVLQLRRSFMDAIFSPRFGDSGPEATEGARFVGEWYSLPQAPAPAPVPVAAPEESAPAGSG